MAVWSCLERRIMHRLFFSTLSILMLTNVLILGQDFEVSIQVDDGVDSNNLVLGVNPDGTQGFDPGLDLYAPPMPPTGAFDARFSTLGEDYIIDILDNTINEKQFHMSYQISAGNGPIVLHWDSAHLDSLGIFLIVDDITGNLFDPIDMTTIDSLEVIDPIIIDKLRILVTPFAWIPASSITLTSPNGGELWQVGTQHNITWTDNIVGNVKIDLYKNEVFSSNIVVSTPSTGTYQWTIANDLQEGSDYKIKIISVNDESVFDMSDSSFNILWGSITLSSPNSGEIWQAGTLHPITWIDNINENVKIELYKGGFFHSEITPSTSSNGSTNWEIPFDLESGTNYKVKLTSVNNSDIYDFSDNNFSIIGNQITVTSPNGGEQWIIGSAYEITWDDNLDGNVQILLRKSGQLSLIISSSTASDGSRPWTVPSVVPGSDYKIDISSFEYGNILDESDDFFTIRNPTDVEEMFSGIPDTYQLMQNYPNPFNPNTTIYYALPEAGSVELVIYDVLGNEVMKYSEHQEAGYHKFEFDGANLPSGIYFYLLRAGDFIETKKMVLLK